MDISEGVEYSYFNENVRLTFNDRKQAHSIDRCWTS